MITLADFVAYPAQRTCAGPNNEYFGTAVKMLNGGVYPTPYDYTQRRIIDNRYRRQAYRRRARRAAPEDKRSYGTFCLLMGVVVAILVGIAVFRRG